MRIQRRPRPAAAPVQMRIMLLGETGTEPGFVAWRRVLTRAGVPFDAVAVAGRDRVAGLHEASGALRYQALIVTRSGVDSALDSCWRQTLARAQREVGLRRLTAYAYPAPSCGLRPPAWAGNLDDVDATLTEPGRRLFDYLRGPVPFDAGSWGYLSTPVDRESFETLLATADGSSLLGIHRDEHRRQHMVQTFDTGVDQLQGLLLCQGQLTWLTGGAYLGHRRNHLSVQVDDVLLPNYGWDAARHVTAIDRSAMLRMRAEDAVRTARWSRRSSIRLDLACNGSGSRRFMQEHGLDRDPLLDALLCERDTFRWINHTFEHRNLDGASKELIGQEIEHNRRWARQHGIELEPHTLVTGGHTGLANLALSPPRAENQCLGEALRDHDIRYVGCDASRPYPVTGSDIDGPRLPPGTPFVVGGALAIPRHPTELAHDVATEEQLMDRLRSSGRSLATSPIRVMAEQARGIIRKVLSNDARPHYCHQSNLLGGSETGEESGDGGGSLLCRLLDETLTLYRRLIVWPVMPLVQPGMSEIGRTLLRRQVWRDAWVGGQVGGYLEDRSLTIVNRGSGALEIPLTGAADGEDYAGTSSGWASVPPGRTVFKRP